MESLLLRSHLHLHHLLLLFLLVFSGSPSLLSYARRNKVDLEPRFLEPEVILHSNHSTFSVGFDPSQVIQLLWSPRIFLYESFLSDEECDHLLSLAKGELEKFAVNSSSRNTTTGSTHTMLLSRDQDKVVSRIEERISTWTFLPKENGEGMQLLHFAVNGTKDSHHDYYHNTSKLANGSAQIATILMYLSNVTMGGETTFPHSEFGIQMKDKSWSDCAAVDYGVKPLKGSALLLFNLHPDATPDVSSLRRECSVLNGEKWMAAKHIYVRDPTVSNIDLVSDEECTDEDANCPHWAKTGECQRNPVFMLGTPDYYGSCRKSCGAC